MSAVPTSTRKSTGPWATLWNTLAPALLAAFRLYARRDEKAAGYFEIRQDLDARLTEIAAAAPGAPRVLVHAASVGETLMAMPILATLTDRGFRAALSYTSVSVARNMPKNIRAEIILPAPFDAPRPVRAWLDAVRPAAVIFSTYDVWPGFASECARRGLPMAMVNAQLPAASGRLKFPARAFYRRLYGLLDAVGAAAPEDAARFESIGLAGRGAVTGNCRFDQTIARCRAVTDNDPDLSLVARASGGTGILPVSSDHGLEGHATLVGGSVWPEDLSRLLPVLGRLMAERPDLRAVLAPHEINEDHVSEPEKFFQGLGIGTVRWSALKKGAAAERVVIVDALGVLYKLYKRGTVAYVGGSFRKEIHSVMEPAGMGLPVLMGPMHGNSPEALEMKAAGGAVAVADEAGLEAALRNWLDDEAARADAAAKAFAVVDRNAGATGRTMDLIRPLLPVARASCP